VTLVDDMAERNIDIDLDIGTNGDGQLHEPWVFLTMLDQMATSEVNIGFIYSVIDLLARRYQLTDAVVVLRDEALGTQAFRLGQKSLDGDSPAADATSPGVFCEPDCVPNVVRDVVRNVCQLALTLHLARHSADHDPLTNIANRRSFDAALRNASVQSARYGWAFTLVLIDLDGFKAVNDKLGHAVGDDMLRSFGWALRRSVRSGDTTARMGGDEFAIILANAEGTEVLAFTERLRALLVSLPELDFSVGTATSPADSTDPAELYRIADARLYEKKGIVLR
jgi:diguanylate cyclase (GGDEF)-like protein